MAHVLEFPTFLLRRQQNDPLCQSLHLKCQRLCFQVWFSCSLVLFPSWFLLCWACALLILLPACLERQQLSPAHTSSWIVRMTVSWGCSITDCDSGWHIFLFFRFVSWIYSLEVIFGTLLFIAELSVNAPGVPTSTWEELGIERNCEEKKRERDRKCEEIWIQLFLIVGQNKDSQPGQGLRSQCEHTS